MKTLEGQPLLVGLMRRLETAEVLDRPVRAIEPTIQSVFGSGVRGAALRGDWLGHALHPLLTDVVIGSWTSATVLDVLGRGHWSAPAKALVATGLAAVGPTAWTGWAEWSASSARDKRVGLVHVAGVGLAIGMYASSWVARTRGNHHRGARLAMAGAGAAGAAGYLGGHLALARNVGSHHPAFDAASLP